MTVKDVAEAAGVSAMTVSRVVNGNSNVRADKRQAVLDAIENLQYKPNTAARTLAAGDATQIGLLYSNPSAAYLSQFLIGALAGARRAGCHLVLEPCEGESADEQAEATRQFAGAGVQGVILPPPLSESAPVRAELDAAEIPSVAIAMGRPSPGSLNVRIDDFDAAQAMTRHLLELGHREIAFIRGHPNQLASSERFRGFVAALEQAGLDPAEARVEQGYFTFRSGTFAAERLLARAPRPTAIFACNDDMAAAAIGVAHRQGLRVPDDISIVGFDDTAIATNVWPELTTIRQPIAQMAETAISMLLDRLKAGDPVDAMHEQVFAHELIVRESTAAPPTPRIAVGVRHHRAAS
ncbi:LacI family transcriptional regulator [Sphingomonas japonica]|uniref:LacI family transcriptional regulator n=1 Tax=Sphingomonas japonica TaxID=511662 RepID=A0ABX0TZ00_9SPHN|nr:LacI family transcriptional regulator [Sphingomonas japonica]